MKSNDNLTHAEINDALATCLRDLMGTEISHRHMPLYINRGKAVSSIVTSAHREELMESKRQIALGKTTEAQVTATKKLKAK